MSARDEGQNQGWPGATMARLVLTIYLDYRLFSAAEREAWLLRGLEVSLSAASASLTLDSVQIRYRGLQHFESSFD